ncbi:MAG: phenylalanine--tRNA ligase subunit beta, partial [Propionibacteriaceae bacterium]
MKAPMSWLRAYAALSDELDPRVLSDAYIRAGLEVEGIEEAGADVSGPVVVGRVLDFTDEPQKNGRTIRWCAVDVGEHNPAGEPHRGIVCGASNFAVGDLVVVVLPGATLPGGFEIAARTTYGHVSDGMICAEDELGLGHDHTGIIVLPPVDDHGQAVQPGQSATELLHLRETVLDIDITPDMSFCMSIRGLAREAAQAFGVAFTDPVDRATPTGSSDHSGYPVQLADARCPLFVAVTVRDLDPGARTPGWLKRCLQLSGVRSISLAVDVTNYVMLELGQPLHGYDEARLTGPIVVRPGHQGESVTTLDGQVRPVGEADLMITDDTGAIGMAGVMGGASTEINPDTTAVVIEAAVFDPTSISRTSRGQRLASEASRRFERGVDPGAAYAAAHRAAGLLVRLGGGRLSGETVAGSVPVPPTQVLPADLPARILGMPVDPDTVVAVLTASGVRVEPDGDRLLLTPPSWRV